MTINILYLYHDLMNLYGESGNLKAIVYSLSNQNIDVNIDKLSLEDNIDFSKYNLIYIGSGTEKNQLIALENMLKYKEQIKEYINNDKFILATGNSFELFGEKIGNNRALGLLKFQSLYLEKRKVGDYIKSSAYGQIVAFENRGSKIVNNSNPFLDEEIGVHYKNLYGTYLIGPLMVRSPEFNQYFITQLINSIDENYTIKKFDLELNEKANLSYFKTYYPQKPYASLK